MYTDGIATGRVIDGKWVYNFDGGDYGRVGVKGCGDLRLLPP